MTTNRDVTTWDFLSMCLWSTFFAVGLVPEYVFHGLREFANVSTRVAFVNSSAVITISLCAYVAFFVARQCRYSNLNAGNRQAKAIHATLISILAFIEIPGQSPVFGTQTLLGLMLRSSLQVDQSLKMMLWAVGCTKIIAWCYLYSLVLRFHVFGNRQVFANMPTFFLYVPEKSEADEAPPVESEPTPSVDENTL